MLRCLYVTTAACVFEKAAVIAPLAFDEVIAAVSLLLLCSTGTKHR